MPATRSAPDASLASLEQLQPPMGANASSQALIAACPNRRYKDCFYAALRAKYPVTQFALPPLPKHCAEVDGAKALADPACVLPPAERTLQHTTGPALPLCSPSSPSAAPAAPASRPSASARLRCDSPAAAVNAHAVLLLGVPSSPTATGRLRRSAIRDSWLNDEHVGRTVVVCFLLSSRTPSDALEPMRREQAEHGDMLFLDAPETPWLITQPTKYSGYKKRGRGMPTFKQYAFFQHAAAHHGPVPFVGKIDDDTAPNLRVLVPFLRRLGCLGPSPFAFVGATNWAALVPQAHEFGVRADRCVHGWRRLGCRLAAGCRVPDWYPCFGCHGLACRPPRPRPRRPRRPQRPRRAARIGRRRRALATPCMLIGRALVLRACRCGFGWDLGAALHNFGSSFGTPGAPGYVESCDTRGAVLPFPYGTGAGYLFSSALLRWVATSAEVTGWVAAAAGESREALQWQKFEDTSTGYMVSRAPTTVRYVDIGPLVHDISCHAQGERKRRGGATYRPPANSSVFVHNLKGPAAFAFAWEHMQACRPPLPASARLVRSPRPLASSARRVRSPLSAFDASAFAWDHMQPSLAPPIW